MRINRIEVFPVAIPLARPYRDATRVETHSRDVLVRIRGDGTAGWGAGSPRSFPTGETQIGTVHVLEAYLVPALAGLDPTAIEAAHRAMAAAIPGNMAAKAAIDIALHDLVGRAQGRPVYDLLGGLVRDSMPALDILPLEPPARMAEIARAVAARGTRAFKIKIDADIGVGLDRVRAVREAVPGAMLVVDANGAWTVGEAIAACARLEDLGVDVVEQPVPGEDLDGLVTVTRATRLRVAADESARPEFLDRLIASRAADIVNLKVTREGGLLPATRAAAAAERAGIEVVSGSLIHTALIDAAAAHFFASTPRIAYNESGKAPFWHPVDVVRGLRVEAGIVHVPDGPGLGVEVDEELVRRSRPTD